MEKDKRAYLVYFGQNNAAVVTDDLEQVQYVPGITYSLVIDFGETLFKKLLKTKIFKTFEEYFNHIKDHEQII